jgi:hypothetical protein
MPNAPSVAAASAALEAAREREEAREAADRARWPDYQSERYPLLPDRAEWDLTAEEQQQWVDHWREANPTAIPRNHAGTVIDPAHDALLEHRNAVALERSHRAFESWTAKSCQLCGARTSDEPVYLGEARIQTCAVHRGVVLAAVAERRAEELLPTGLTVAQTARQLVDRALEPSGG